MWRLFMMDINSNQFRHDLTMAPCYGVGGVAEGVAGHFYDQSVHLNLKFGNPC